MQPPPRPEARDIGAAVSERSIMDGGLLTRRMDPDDHPARLQGWSQRHCRAVWRGSRSETLVILQPDVPAAMAPTLYDPATPLGNGFRSSLEGGPDDHRDPSVW